MPQSMVNTCFKIKIFKLLKICGVYNTLPNEEFISDWCTETFLDSLLFEKKVYSLLIWMFIIIIIIYNSYFLQRIMICVL